MGIELYENAEKSNAPTQSKNAAAGKRVTLKDVAEKSGFSLRTVKKVMGGKEYVSESVKEKVVMAGKQLNYKRNKIASALAKNRDIKIAIVYTKTSKYYFPDISKGFISCAKDYLDYGIEIEFFVDNEAKQNFSIAQVRQLQELQNRDDIDGIVIQPYTSKQLAFEINKLTAAGKPVVAFGSDILDSKRLCCVGPDGYKSGRMAAQILGNYVGRKGKVYVERMQQGHRQTAFRLEGFLDKIKESFPDICIIEQDDKNLFEDGYTHVKNMVDSGASGIFYPSANVYLIGQALKDLDNKDVVVVGYDLSEKTQQLLKENYIKAIMFQNPKLQAYKSLKIMCDYLLEGTRPSGSRIYSGMSILTGECL